MNLFNTFKKGLDNHFEKKKEQRELEERLQREANLERLRIFEEEMRKNMAEVAKHMAKEDAMKKSGLAKLRATSRLESLGKNPPTPGSWYEKFAQHTQRNLAKREERLKKTQKMRDAAQKMRLQKPNNFGRK